MTVLVTTHYMDEAEQCDRLAFILDGALIAEGAPPDLKRDLADRIVQVTPPSDPFLALEEVQKDPALEDAYLFGARLRAVAKPGAVDAARSLLARFAPPEPAEPSLEDVFVSLARKQRGRGRRLRHETVPGPRPQGVSAAQEGPPDAAHDRHGARSSRR